MLAFDADVTSSGDAVRRCKKSCTCSDADPAPKSGRGAATDAVTGDVAVVGVEVDESPFFGDATAAAVDRARNGDTDVE